MHLIVIKILSQCQKIGFIFQYIFQNIIAHLLFCDVFVYTILHDKNEAFIIATNTIVALFA